MADAKADVLILKLLERNGTVWQINLPWPYAPPQCGTSLPLPYKIIAIDEIDDGERDFYEVTGALEDFSNDYYQMLEGQMLQGGAGPGQAKEGIAQVRRNNAEMIRQLRGTGDRITTRIRRKDVYRSEDVMSEAAYAAYKAELDKEDEEPAAPVAAPYDPTSGIDLS
jgi:hypothetical protein